MPEDKQQPTKIISQKLRVPFTMAIGTMLFGAFLWDRCVVDGVETRLDTINETLQETRTPLQLYQRDVIGGPAVESFYEINGQRAYLIINGQPVEFYHPEGLPAR